MWFWLRQVWRWSWVITLPIALVFAIWANQTFDRYWTFGVRYDAKPLNTRLSRVGMMEFQHLLRRFQLAVLPAGHQQPIDLKTIDLFLSEANLERLNSNLPHSGGQYVEGRLAYDGRLSKVKVKYRGDFVWHWGYYKKSLRIKTKKKRLYANLRAFNLIAPKRPELLNNFLGYKLAETLGLLSPYVELVNLRLNGELRGIHILTEQLTELTLRRHGRLPGDLYAGELQAKDRVHGISNQVFYHPGAWQKIAVNNHFPEESRKPLERLLQLLTGPQSEAAQAELIGLLDLDKWGQFSALETLLQTIHFTNVHNWRLYFDPARGVFEPVVWDTNGWLWGPKPDQEVQLDLMPSKLHQVLMKNYQFLYARQQALETFFENGVDQIFLQGVDRAISSLQGAVMVDPNLVEGLRYLSPEDVKVAMGKLRRTIVRTFQTIREAYLGNDGVVRYSVSNNDDPWIKIEISGRRPVRTLRFEYTQQLLGLRGVRVRYWQDGTPVTVDVSNATSIRGDELVLDFPLFARFTPAIQERKNRNAVWARQLKVEPGYYELLIDGAPAPNQLVGLSTARDGMIPVKRVAHLQRHEFSEAYGLVQAAPRQAREVWKGEMLIEGVRQIKGDVIIRPGTTVRLGPGASVLISGHLLAEGQADKPIRFVPMRDGQSPWGTIVLHGPGANSSRLSFCEFVGGSGLKGDLFEYSGMFSVHDVDEVWVRHCKFLDSRIVDDMVHVVYSSISFSDSVFQGALSDAVDLDISTAVIERCAFLESGNDGLDLMASRVVVRDSMLRANGDKGLSVGEKSSVFAFNSQFLENAIGVQVKDGSEAILYNTDLVGNQKAIDAYKKNWQYGGGGRIRVYKSYIEGNGETFTSDKVSHIWVYDSYVKGRQAVPQQVTLDKTVDGRRKRIARQRNLWRHPDEELAPAIFSRYWPTVDPMRRGAGQVAN